MALISVAVEYIEIHRAGSSDEEIARALREQGFSDETVAAAFRAAGGRAVPVAPAQRASSRRALVFVLAAASALFSAAAALLFIRNLSRAIGR